MVMVHTHRQAITVKYHGPSNTRGSRLSATSRAGRVYVEYDDGITHDANYQNAAQALADKFGWIGRYVGGETHNGITVFVAVE